MESQVAGGVQGPSTRRVASSDERLEAAASIPGVGADVEKQVVAVDCWWWWRQPYGGLEARKQICQARVYGRND
jgi:hypothetical protein